MLAKQPKAYQDLAQVTSAISTAIANHKKAVTPQNGFSSRPISCRVRKTSPESEPLLFCVMACLCLLAAFSICFVAHAAGHVQLGIAGAVKG